MNTMLLADWTREGHANLSFLITFGIMALIGMAIFVWAVVRLIRFWNVKVAGIPAIGWLIIILCAGSIGQIIFLVMSYSYQKKQKEAAASGYYFDGVNYYPLSASGGNPTSPFGAAGAYGTPGAAGAYGAAGAAPFGAPTAPGAAPTMPYGQPVYPTSPNSPFTQNYPFPGSNGAGASEITSGVNASGSTNAGDGASASDLGMGGFSETSASSSGETGSRSSSDGEVNGSSHQ